jgi:hypothetical protein
MGIARLIATRSSKKSGLVARSFYSSYGSDLAAAAAGRAHVIGLRVRGRIHARIRAAGGSLRRRKRSGCENQRSKRRSDVRAHVQSPLFLSPDDNEARRVRFCLSATSHISLKASSERISGLQNLRISFGRWSPSNKADRCTQSSLGKLGTRQAPASFHMQEDLTMLADIDGHTNLMARRICAFPAPLCETCNVAMALNAGFADQSHRREYQCRQCGAAKMVRRSHASATGFRSTSVASPPRPASPAPP